VCESLIDTFLSVCLSGQHADGLGPGSLFSQRSWFNPEALASQKVRAGVTESAAGIPERNELALLK
jgi:hypothetical protein